MGVEAFIKPVTLEEYKDRYADYLVLERDEGVLTVRMHTDGGPCEFGMGLHNALGQAWFDIGRDMENEVVILAGTGGEWLVRQRVDPPGPSHLRNLSADEYYEMTYYDQTKLVEGLLWNIDVPTIAAYSGKGGPHCETALLCDLTLCSNTAMFEDLHLVKFGIPAGDGLGLTLQELMGFKRAAYYLYTGKPIDAQAALEWGLVNEVLPEADLLPRCQELARQIIESAPRATRRLQSQIVKRSWKRRFLDDYQMHIGHELLAMLNNRPR